MTITFSSFGDICNAWLHNWAAMKWATQVRWTSVKVLSCVPIFSDEYMEIFFKIVDEPFHIRLICEITSLELTKMMETLVMVSRIDQSITKGSGQLALFLHFNILK